MKKAKKKKIIVPESITQHVEDEFRKNLEFRAAYIDEIARLKISRKIITLRKGKHLTQTQLAKRMKTTQQTISRLEDTENVEITLITLSKLAMALGTRLKIDFVQQKKEELAID